MGVSKPCVFCAIERGEADACIVHRDEQVLAFLDRTPLFLGHVLVIPRAYIATLPELPVDQVGPLFQRVQLITCAVQRAFDAAGTFVAMNNTISQSVPHLHIHVVPRNKGDGLRGFFWPRQRYRDAAHMEETAAALRAIL